MIEQEIGKIQKQEAEIDKILDRKKIFEEQLRTEQNTLLQIQKDLEKHLQQFTWKPFSPDQEDDFEKKRSDSFALEKKVEETDRNIALERENLEKENQLLEKFRTALDDFKNKELSKEEQIKISLSSLKILTWTAYEQKEIAEVENAYQKLVVSNKETEENYQKAVQQEKILAPQLAAQKTIVSQAEKQIAELEKEISENRNSMANALAAQNFTEFKEVENILLQEINIEQNRNTIQKFNIDFETLKKFIEELEIKLKDLSFDDEHFSLTEKLFTEAQGEQKQISDSVVTKIAEIDRLEKEYIKKKVF